MRCVECTKHVCRKCLTLEPEAAWDIEFCCPPCLVDGLFKLPCDDRPGPDYLLHLALQSLKSSSARLALSTWRSYHRCVQKVVEFMAKQGVVCFPVMTTALAQGCMLFFQHLRQNGATWSTMRTFRSAFKSFHVALGLPDPWIAFPILLMLTQGLQKQVSIPARPKVGLTIVMLKAILLYMDGNETELRLAGQFNAADVLLRDAVALILGFFAMRRSDELFMNKEHTHGILQSHVVLVFASHVTLFVPAQKNDKLQQGHFVTLAWVTGSGVPIGAWILRLLRRLQSCGCLDPKVPLFLPTIGHLGYRRVLVGRPVSKPQTLRKILPRVFHVFVTSPLLLSLFGWHSCRRGGATHGYHNGVTLDLLAPHGGWFTQQGLKAYTSAAFEQRLSVTLRM